ncbi:hypothetical protein PTTG_03688 [Puccinia triticina 1-1 BBBD Race 1]|uniref:Uncharacterized protein n=1 Tax=Puccinia triticina (isolate 1-1 / race 1 (BBBD)) TaxID=630390 RepID=A0A180GHJ0_PUCT1|nr:hypothetical protein PTTG_03688 [Puccinia triticina 1-1 BBBD Race 1]
MSCSCATHRPWATAPVNNSPMNDIQHQTQLPILQSPVVGMLHSPVVSVLQSRFPAPWAVLADCSPEGIGWSHGKPHPAFDPPPPAHPKKPQQGWTAADQNLWTDSSGASAREPEQQKRVPPAGGAGAGVLINAHPSPGGTPTPMPFKKGVWDRTPANIWLHAQFYGTFTFAYKTTIADLCF